MIILFIPIADYLDLIQGVLEFNTGISDWSIYSNQLEYNAENTETTGALKGNQNITTTIG